MMHVLCFHMHCKWVSVWRSRLSCAKERHMCRSWCKTPRQHDTVSIVHLHCFPLHESSFCVFCSVRSYVHKCDWHICYVICQSWRCVRMHILHVYIINCIWGTRTCTQGISRGAAYICSSLINSMQNAICQLHCHRLQSATCVFRDGSGGKLKSQQASLTPPPQTSVQSQSLTCCFTFDTNTWGKDGVHFVRGKLL